MTSDLPFLPTLAGLIEFGGALIIAVAVVRALATLATGGKIEHARLLIVGGSLNALGYKSAATLLKAVELGTWISIGTFAAIYALRTLIKQFLTWERTRLCKIGPE